MKKEIPGFGTVTVERFAPLRGLRVKAKIAKAVGPMISTLLPFIKSIAREDGSVDLATIDVEKAAPIIGQALALIDPDELPGLVREVLSNTSVDTFVDDPSKRNKRKAATFDLCDEGAIDRAFADNERALFVTLGVALKEIWTFSGGSASDRTAPPTPTL